MFDVRILRRSAPSALEPLVRPRHLPPFSCSAFSAASCRTCQSAVPSLTSTMCLQERQVYSRQTSPVNVFLSVWSSSPPHLGQLSLGVDFVIRGLTGLGNEGRGLDVGGEFLLVLTPLVAQARGATALLHPRPPAGLEADAARLPPVLLLFPDPRRKSPCLFTAVDGRNLAGSGVRRLGPGRADRCF